MDRPLRLGTRASRLARWQADWVAGRLQAAGHAVELVLIRTTGDQNKSGPVASLGGQGVFTKELQRALLDQRIDLAVHSMKDLPTAPVDDLLLAAVPPREAAQDALVAASAPDLQQLPQGAVVGTGSTRRRSQLLYARPDLQVRDLRGNVGTRLEKLDRGDYDAIVLAEAGLRRLGLADRITQLLPGEVMLPAPAQGALAIECRAADAATLAAVEPMDDPASHAAVTAERAALRRLEGGCLAAMGAWAEVVDGALALSAVVLSTDGRQRLEVSRSDSELAPQDLGIAVADELLQQGAAALLRERC